MHKLKKYEEPSGKPCGFCLDTTIIPLGDAAGGTLLYHKIYMYVPSKFTIKKDYFFHKNKVKCN